MKTIEIKLFQYDELTKEAQQKAREWWRRGECESGDLYWSECTIDEAVEQGQYMGIEFDGRDRTSMSGKPLPPEPKIWWSGFSCQGDGACFEGVWRAASVQADKVADGWGDAPETTELKRIASEFDRIAKKYPYAYFRVKHSGHYSHKYCTEFDVDLDGAEESESSITQDEWAKVEKELIENARDFMEWIYRQLERAYEDYTSDEQVAESIRINEYDFTEDGERWRD